MGGRAKCKKGKGEERGEREERDGGELDERCEGLGKRRQMTRKWGKRGRKEVKDGKNINTMRKVRMKERIQAMKGREGNVVRKEDGGRGKKEET